MGKVIEFPTEERRLQVMKDRRGEDSTGALSLRFGVPSWAKVPYNIDKSTLQVFDWTEKEPK